MDSDLRGAAVAALIELARSHHYRDRADAGKALAALADTPEALDPLLELVLDPADTYVTRVTSEALLRRKDSIGLKVVASALAIADPSHSEWIHTAVDDVLTLFGDDRDNAMRLCEEMSHDTDGRIALGARQLRQALAEIDPVFGPAQRGPTPT
ncbi:HEAT repeat domain-containing protein [Streptomyces sp. CB03911]|uniref:HEAT repeat domain-containing protein n=1 Tax=Streptomyces sp. CB03911 TaxID=1804758 RepID=UPI000939ECB0|nr:HEAT repeat domain-containing protein [Streptomyces sp. CB03911]OKI15989.1 hypothetical protein A6A07_40950 [Streptomyces sp. CB03911]